MCTGTTNHPLRLRNAEGKELRNNAEKSVALNEWFIDLFTPEGGVVWDVFAGTASMALACIKTRRSYVGCEPDTCACGLPKELEGLGLPSNVEKWLRHMEAFDDHWRNR